MRKNAGMVLMALVAFAVAAWMGSCHGGVKDRRNLVIIGIDAGSWNVIDPLLKQGKLPNLGRLVAQGASMELKTFKRTHSSPVLWTSILTGKKPPKHGIQGYVSPKGFPVASYMRKVKDLPELLSQGGYKVGFVGFWASWPAEKVRGWNVSEVFSLGRYKDTSAGANLSANDYSYLLKIKEVTYPEELLLEIYPLLLSPEQIPIETYSRVLPLGEGDAQRFQSIRLVAREDIESLLKFSLVSDLNYRNAALYLLEKKQPEVLAVYFEGADITGHFFWRYMEPEYFPKSPAADQERYQEVIKNYYVMLDDFIGQLRQAAGPETAFLVISDHGMVRVPREGADGSHSGTHVRSHPDGVLIFSGPGIQSSAGQKIEPGGLLDVTPTILYYLGLPVADDMDGKPMMQLFTREFIKNHPLRRISTYDKKPRTAPEKHSALDQAQIEKLKSLGYLH